MSAYEGAGESRPSHPEELVRKAVVRSRAQLAELTVLEVHLLFRRPHPVVCLKVSGARPGMRDIAWELTYQSFEPEGSGEAQLPSTLGSDVGYRLAALGESGPTSRPLWLKLARPYGKLGNLAWERVLGDALQRPILRLPDYPDRPAERSGRLDHMILVDPPSSTRGTTVAARVRVLADALLAGSAAPATQVHVFAGVRWYRHLAGLARDRILVHDPMRAQEPAVHLEATGSEAWQRMRGAPWSNWVAETMQLHGVDAVHLLCRARREEASCQLLLSSRPWVDDAAAPLAVIEIDELALLLNRAGAWALSLLPPVPGGDLALAAVADSIAHRRPGAVLYHPSAATGDEAVLREVARFMFSGGSAPAVSLREGFLYCHPSFVTGEALAGSGAGRGRNRSGSALAPQTDELALSRLELGSGDGAGHGGDHGAGGTAAALATEPAPDWLGSAQRFLESAVLEQVRRQGSDVLLTGSSNGHASAAAAPTAASAAAVETLYDIRNVVQDYLAKRVKE
jgi:hypothetical protein